MGSAALAKVAVIAATILGASDALAPGLECRPAGVFTTRKVRAGEVLLEIEQSAVISEPAGPGALARMAMRLIRGEGDAALAELKPPDGLHRWLGDAALDELRWPPLLAAARRDREWLERMYAELGAEETDGVGLDRFIDALDVCRGYALSRGGELHLLPGVGAFGWSARRGATLEQSGTTIRLTCTENLGPEGLITLNGGWRTNQELLLEQGFACAELSSDAVYFSADAVLDAAAAAGVLDPAVADLRTEVIAELARLKYLASSPQAVPGAQSNGGLGAAAGEQAGLAGALHNGDELAVLSGGFASDMLGILLQAACIGPAEAEALSTAARPALGAAISIGEGVVLSIDHEVRVGSALRALCDRSIALSTADLAADEAALAAHEASAPRPPGAGPPLGDASGRSIEALRARISRARCLAECGKRASAYAERPTMTATLRRPWKANVRASG